MFSETAENFGNIQPILPQSCHAPGSDVLSGLYSRSQNKTSVIKYSCCQWKVLMDLFFPPCVSDDLTKLCPCCSG